MAIKIKFDSTHNVITPTFVLATRSGHRIGAIPATHIVLSDALNAQFDLEFQVYKFSNGKEYPFWDDIVDFKLIWCPEWDVWFEAYVTIQEENSTVKQVSCVSVGEAELSQTNLYDVQINTEDDIAQDDYVPTVLYNAGNPRGSLLHRIMEKIPHYTVKHVDASIANIQRTFTFDGTSIYDAFQEISSEIDCLFVIDSGSEEDGSISRSISVYDLESCCKQCGYRESFMGTCPECGSTNISPGYGEDTTIFISTENLADNITFTTDNGSVKNCFKLVAGDDLMTSTVINCNPNGSDYIWYIPEYMKEDMSPELVAKLEAYQKDYRYYQNEYKANISSGMLTSYNNLIKKYQAYSKDYKEIASPIVGYAALMEAYYGVVDFYLFLHDSLMPPVDTDKSTAQKEVAKLSASSLSPIAVASLKACSKASADSAVQGMAKAIVNSRYQVKVAESTYTTGGSSWTGKLTVTNYSNDEDTTTTGSITVTISEDFENYVRQKMKKALRTAEEQDDITDIVELFESTDAVFQSELKKYSLQRLEDFRNDAQTCLDVLIEQGVANNETWADQHPNMYQKLYVPYYNRLKWIESELKVREGELAIVEGKFDNNGGIVSDGMETLIEKERDFIQKKLDLETYLGEPLWLEFVAYRREDTYSNDNYISDGLDTAALFDNAREFLKTAEKEIYKSANLQHSISATLKNLLVMKEFVPIVDYFAVGNWLRIRVDDEIYRLRLIEYEIDFDDLENIAITFSDVMNVKDGVSDVGSILAQAQSMSSSYDSTKRQAQKGWTSKTWLDSWVEDGLDATNVKIMSNAENQTQTWDSHGMLFRQYDPITETYDPCQLKIINSTMAITSDDWKTIKTAVGKFLYVDPNTGETKEAYGVNGEVILGKLILGENMQIVNRNGSLSFNDDGFLIQSSIGSFSVSSKSGKPLLELKAGTQQVLWVDTDGKFHLKFEGLDNLESRVEATESGLQAEVSARKTLEGSVSSLKSTVDLLPGQITLAVSAETKAREDADKKLAQTDTELRSDINMLPGKIELSVTENQGQNGDGKASITLSTTRVDNIKNPDQVKNFDVRNSFAKQNSDITISAGIVRFNAGKITLNNDAFKVTAEGIITATSGTIGGFTLDASSFHTKDVVITSAAKNSIGISSSYFTRTIGGVARQNLKLAIGGSFGVDDVGNLYAHNATLTGSADINGKITASSGKIGGFNITATGLSSETSYSPWWDLHGDTVQFDAGDGFGRGAGFNIGSYFGVDRKNGIYASKGTIAGLTMEDGGLSLGGYGYIGTYSGMTGDYPPKQTYGMQLRGISTSVFCVVTDGGARIVNGNNDCHAYESGAGINGAGRTFNVGTNGIVASEGIQQGSDRRIKNSIDYDMSRYENLFMNLKPVNYCLNIEDSGKKHLGFIAQDLETALQDVGMEEKDLAALSKTPKEDDETDYDYGIGYTELIALNTHMIQKLYKRIEDLEKLLAEKNSGKEG